MNRTLNRGYRFEEALTFYWSGGNMNEGWAVHKYYLFQHILIQNRRSINQIIKNLIQ